MTGETRWMLDRAEAVSAAGMVAAKHPLAARAGGEQAVVDFGMIAPRAAAPDMFPLAGGANPGMFGWPSVVDDANLHGSRSIAVPGAPAGFALAAGRFGTMPLADLLQPAIRLAEDGFLPNWHTTLNTATDLWLIVRHPETTRIFAPGGIPWSPLPGMRTPLRQPDLARTLREFAAGGPDAFYTGAIAGRIVREVRETGGILDAEDFAAYRASVVAPLRGRYRGLEILATPAASGGPTVLQTFNQLEGADLAGLGHNSLPALHEIAEACRGAFVDRFTWLADDRQVEVPLAALLSPEYAAERRAELRPDRARMPLLPGDRARLGVGHALGRSVAAYGAPRMTTTHVSVIDRHGNAASLTNTLLSGWGSGVTAPGTGVLLNNGMMWFDPEPGRPNSVAGGKRPLSNMAPVVVVRGGEAFMSLGAMGGRRILNAIPQIVANVADFGMGMQAAITAPRIDLSTGALQASDRIPAATLAALAAMGHDVQPIEEDVLGFEFASPAGVLRRDGVLFGGANPYYPAWAAAAD
ncbi:MAG: gamma-glutamyltransferase family protein [Chloroflexota bacterium]